MRCHKAMPTVLTIFLICCVPVSIARTSDQPPPRSPDKTSEQSTGRAPHEPPGEPGQPGADASPAKEEEGRYLRLARDDEGSPVALEAAIVHCAPKDCGKTGPTVDLVSAESPCPERLPIRATHTDMPYSVPTRACQVRLAAVTNRRLYPQRCA